MNENQKWIVAIFDPAGSEIAKTAPMSLDEASVVAVQLGKLRVTTSMPLLDATPEPRASGIVQTHENLFGWVVIAGAPGERRPIAFLVTLTDAKNYLEDTEYGVSGYNDYVRRAGGPVRQDLIEPEIVPACAVQLLVGDYPQPYVPARVIVEATGMASTSASGRMTAEHPGAKLFLQDAWDRENGRTR